MPAISKYSSMVYRLSQIYFDEQLAPYHIGCGQQFFLLHIYRHPGINQYELAYQDHYDKGTTARAVKKLEAQGYVLRRSDEHDRRITKLYVTKKGEAIVEMINQVLADWHAIITDGLSDEECEVTARLMGRVAANAAAFVKKK